MHARMFRVHCCQWLSGCEDRSQQHDSDMSHGQSHDRSSHDQLRNNMDQPDISPDEGYCPIVFGLESEEEERPDGAEPQMAEVTCLPEQADIDMMSGEHLRLHSLLFYTCCSPCEYMWWARLLLFELLGSLCEVWCALHAVPCML